MNSAANPEGTPAAASSLQALLPALRRWPDVEAANLYAADACDRLILDTCAAAAGPSDRWPDAIAVIGDHYGALALGALALGSTSVRVHTDSLTARRAIEANLARLMPERAGDLEFCTLEQVAQGASSILLALPRGLDVLGEQAAAAAAVADPGAKLFAGGRIKHMSRSMNEVLAAHFTRVDVSLARQKSRVLTASTPRDEQPASSFPATATHQVRGTSFTLHAGAGTFGAARLDPGTRLLLENLPDLSGHATLVDLACGNGAIGICAALENPQLRVDASDHSASAVASTLAAAQRNNLAGRITAVQDDALGRLPDASATLVTLNPPFHIGNTVTADIAFKLIDDAARVLAPGGTLLCVFNSHLRYRSELARRVGPTEQLARDRTFTVTASNRAH
ncbi:methyltransferase [Arthrobacter sp. JUb115]|uniref:class I SAM-dependent methyltransferase n=1 Tax=Arthrobacter sp. JUb115 TaxID=2485108 RepID=UPI0010F02A37|nr:methyltransferase [Arthrobacter sp. JUb115]TDU25354.1 16S rRNA (guanine1207-N2)-methyltransferase [Arthrobacter sp. JUb115]